ncbi:unnamed protein product [Arctogadus glacialis]
MEQGTLPTRLMSNRGVAAADGHTTQGGASSTTTAAAAAVAAVAAAARSQHQMRSPCWNMLPSTDGHTVYRNLGDAQPRISHACLHIEHGCV